MKTPDVRSRCSVPIFHGQGPGPVLLQAPGLVLLPGPAPKTSVPEMWRPLPEAADAAKAWTLLWDEETGRKKVMSPTF